MQHLFHNGHRALAVRGAIAVVFAAALLLWPDIHIQELVMLIGAYVAVDGLVAVVASLRRRALYDLWWIALLEGACGILAGVLTFLWPSMTAMALVVLVGLWSAVTGVIEILMARSLGIDHGFRRIGAGSLAFGLVLIAFPRPASLLLPWLVGAYAFVSGLLLIRLALRLREGPSAGTAA